MRSVLSIALCFSTLLVTTISFSQQASITSIPNLIRYGGALKDAQGAALSSATLGVTFAIYKQQDGGAPVWMETQNVTFDANGQYTVLLGSTTATGLPGDLFSQQEQRWLGVQVEGRPEETRVLLVSVPYAFKAGEAETLGGLPPSAFVQVAQRSSGNLPTSSSSSVEPNPGRDALAIGIDGPVIGGDGTRNYIPIWSTPSYLLSSVIYQDASRNIGIGTTTPVATLDVNGGVNSATNYQIGGSGVLSIGSSPDQNVFLGQGAGSSNIAGQGRSNAFSGYQAGFSNTTGSFNTFTGAQAGSANTTGVQNVFNGVVAGESNTTGFQNTFVGEAAGIDNTTGFQNIFLGNVAGLNNTTGSYDIYIGTPGPSSGTESTTLRIGYPGNQNTAYIAGIYSSTASGGVPVYINSNGQLGTSGGSGLVTSFNGRSGAVVPASGDYNFSLLGGTLGGSQLSGPYSNAVTLSNSANVFYGDGSHLAGIVPGAGSPYYIQNSTSQQANSNFNISGNGTVGGALAALGAVDAGVYKIAGAQVLSATGSTSWNTFLGLSTGQGGPYNTFLGYGAGGPNTGQSNTFVGAFAGASNTTGLANDFFGNGAGGGNTTGSYNDFYGTGAGGNGSNTGNDNDFFGFSSGFFNATGVRNAFYGYESGYHNTSGDSNAFYGDGAGQSNTTGSYNTFFGGYYNGLGNTTGNSNIYIENDGTGTENNTIRIGTQGTLHGQQDVTFIAGIYGSTASGGVPVYINSNGQLGTSGSSLRFKEQVRDMDDSSSRLLKLRPVTFLYKPEYDKGERTLQYGLIAEEVAKVYPELVAYDNDRQPYTVKYQLLAPMLLNEVQKQYHRAEKQSEVMETQQQQIKEQGQEITSLKQQLQLQNAALQERLSRLEALARVEMAAAK